MNIVLCGMMGVGKSTIGVKIAELTGRRWVDTDGVITTRYGRISDIFEYYGEAYFRNLETELVKELSGQDGLVISTGGGLVLRSANSELLKKNGKLFFLRATLETLLGRVLADETRPLLRGTDDAEAQMKALLAQRMPIYEHTADFIVDTDGKSVEETAAEVLALAAGAAQ